MDFLTRLFLHKKGYKRKRRERAFVASFIAIIMLCAEILPIAASGGQTVKEISGYEPAVNDLMADIAAGKSAGQSGLLEYLDSGAYAEKQEYDILLENLLLSSEDGYYELIDSGDAPEAGLVFSPLGAGASDLLLEDAMWMTPSEELQKEEQPAVIPDTEGRAENVPGTVEDATVSAAENAPGTAEDAAEAEAGSAAEDASLPENESTGENASEAENDEENGSEAYPEADPASLPVSEGIQEEQYASYGAGSRIVDVAGADYSLLLSYTEEAAIPPDAVFDATAVTSAEAWEAYASRASEALADVTLFDVQDTEVLGLFDLTIYNSNGNIIQPAAPVRVSVIMQMDPEAEVYAVHFPESSLNSAAASSSYAVQGDGLLEDNGFDSSAQENGLPADEDIIGSENPYVVSGGISLEESLRSAEVISAVNENGSAAVFDAVSFSVYVIVCTTLEQTLTASDGNEYLVTVTYDNTSGIPSDAELSVSEIKEGEAGYEEHVAQSAAALGEKPENLAFARPFDITLKNPETGEEYQPNEAVQVSIELLKEDLNSYASVDVVHIPDGAGEDAQVMDTTIHGEAVEFETDGFSVYVLIASNSTGSEAEADSNHTCALTIGESTHLSEILSALRIEADGVKSATATTENNNLTVDQTAGEEPADWTVMLNSAEVGVLQLTMSDDSTVDITVKPLVTVTANDASKTYGDPEPETFTATVVGLEGEDTVDYSVTRESGKSAGDYTITPSGEAEQDKYVVKYVTGTFTINTKALTITANSETKVYTGNSLSLDSNDYTSTELAEGDTIASVTLAGEQTYLGTCEIVPGAAKIQNQATGEDVTESYDITYVKGSLTVTWPDGMVAKALTAFNGNLATYRITVNPEGYPLTEEGEPYTLKDTFSDNQAINYDSIEVSVYHGSREDVTYDFSGQTGTYTIPDGTEVVIEYTVRVSGTVGEESEFDNTATIGRMVDGNFVAGPSIKVSETRTITPTGTDISGTGGVYSINLFAYAEGHMEQGLEGAVFRLLDSNKQPMYYAAGEHVGEPITFATGEDGYATIALSDENDGLSIRKNIVYFLEMIEAPYQLIDGEYVYYQKDNTFYSFLITDDPSYTYGGILSYFNGDVLKVRCYAEAKGINITKRFSGNYTLTDEQKNGIRFVLQKEALGTASGWVDVESHTYGEFSYGSINFNTGREGGTELEDFATYRVIEENDGRPEDLDETIDNSVSVSVSYQQQGVPVTDDSNEFFVDPDDKLAFSYDFAFTNEYVDHKLTIIKIDENTGAALAGAEFTVYAASGDQTPVKTYTTDDSGSVTIWMEDSGANYAPDTLYYVVETKAPQGYNLPGDPPKAYFYFSAEGSAAPDGIPSGVVATDLRTSYNTVTLSNSSENVSVPVTVIWGVNGDEAWPEDVSRVVVGLYKSVDGAPAQPVVGEDGQPRTLELTKEKYYDTATFVGLPAQEGGKDIAYSVREESVYAGETDIITQFATSSSISGTGWHVVNNQAAVSVLIKKEWHDLNDAVVSDTAGKPSVTFDLYRTTKQSEVASFTRDELVAFLDGTERVRSGLELSANSWSATVESLQKTDKQGNPYYYYALEDVPDNQEDSYTIAAATDAEPRTLTIINKQTPVTVTIKVNDLHLTYGDPVTGYTFEADVKEDGASVNITGPDDGGKYIAAVTAENGSVSNIEFTISGDSSNDAGVHVVTPSGDPIQAGYRVLYESGTLTIDRAAVTITAGAEKVYGETDPDLFTIEGLVYGEDSSVLSYAASREEGEDVGSYPITLTGSSVQGNYVVSFDRTNAVFKIKPAQATVKAMDDSKTYGEDDPVFTAEVEGLQHGDEPTIISYDLTRTSGEDIGTYTITATGDAVQGNYTVTYEDAKFTISRAALTVKVETTEKTYGDPDPEWEVEINGLMRNEDSGTLSSVLNEETGARDYTYTVVEGESEKTLLTFAVSRLEGENVGEYVVTPSGDETQGNYTLAFEEGNLEILRAELIVTPDRIVKAIGIAEDPLLTATVTGWKGGDDDATASYEIGEGENAGTITWTYTLGSEPLLTFTLKREAGEDEGEYQITALGGEKQSNYLVDYEPGSFGILAILDVDVKQPLVDHADAEANPEYEYTATIDLAGTGLTDYNKNGFALDEDSGLYVQSFTLPAEDKSSMKTLKVPGGAKLNVRQNNTNMDYTTVVRLDGGSYANAEDPLLCKIDGVDTYHEIAFTHSRISLPVAAKAATGQTEEGAIPLAGREGAMGIPDGARDINADFADEMHSNISYELPTDMYYVYDHASLYTKAGVAIDGASNVEKIQYIREEDKWQYKTESSEAFEDIPGNSQLVLFYMPKFVCKIGTVKFYSLKKAVEYADEHGKTATIEMLIGEYSIRSSADAVTIPVDCDITITTAETEYEGVGIAVISRSMGYTGGHLFTNDGKLTLDRISLDGKKLQATDALVLNRTDEAALTVNVNGTLQNANGNNGGAIYVKAGIVTMNGVLRDNTATNGGAVYVNGGEVTLDTMYRNSAINGGAVYVNAGEVTINSKVSANTATNGGAVYLIKGVTNQNSTLIVTGSGSLEENEAVNGGAVYQASGTLSVSGGMSRNTASSNGGAVYLAGGTFEAEANGSLFGNSAAENGGAIYQTGGTLTDNGIVSANTASNGGGIYRVGGTLTVGGTVSDNTASGNGGGVHSTGGTLDVNATITGNSAVNGGAIYASGATLNLKGGTIGKDEAGKHNSATGNGGAIYALNTTTVIGGETVNNVATAGSKTTVAGNTASSDGGALYMEGGSVTLLAASALTDNGANNGGAIYATSGAITLTNGSLSGNEAEASGGAIYAASASVKVETNGAVSNNSANQGNGGGVYAGSGSVTISGGTLSGNSASRGDSEETTFGLGGAVYAGTGTVSYTGGNINGGNTAVNGAAIYVGSGIANVSASITGNTASNGGAVGVGSVNARLNFTGNANVYDNTMNNAQSNVYLDVDSELVINANSLNSGKKIGIYVPGDLDSDQVVKHGDVTGYFGAYVSAGTLTNMPNVFKNDRFTGLKVQYENNRLYWFENLTYDIYYLKNYDSQFPPTSNYGATPSKKVCSGKTYAPRTRESDIYDLVMAMKLYEKHVTDFEKNVDKNNYASLAVYAYTYSDKAMYDSTAADKGFGNYLKTVSWDATARKWTYIKQDGTAAPADTTKLVIFYSAPAYLTIVNNNDDGLELDISELTVLGNDATQGIYGFVTAKNGATIQTLRTITADDMKLKAGDSIKLMFPGAQGQSFTLTGTFTGDGAGESTSVSYTLNGAANTNTGISFNVSADLYADDTATEIILGDDLPICKIGDEPFSTLKAAMVYAAAQKEATGSNTYKIEMLVDYLVPKNDVLDIPAGYDITFTTASRDAATLPFTGSGTRAILSRDTGNTGSSVTATNSTLTVDKLAFDGRSLTAGGKGGAVSATNCTTVTITNCEFKGYRADNGGAVYVANTNAGSSLTVEDCDFSNCQTNASVDKAGGGGIWTTARELYVRNCTFDSCACLKGSAQAGSIFHNIQSGWSTDSTTWVSGCTFSNSYSVGGSGGTIESDALDITVMNCSFDGSYSNKSGGNGGAINVYANNEASTRKDCILRVVGCTFNNCSSKNGSAVGGAVRSTTKRMLLWGCTFNDTQSVTGGAAAMTNTSPVKLEIYRCSFNNSRATGNGGAVSAAVPTLIVEDSPRADADLGDIVPAEVNLRGVEHTSFTDCSANRGGGIDNPANDASVSMQNVSFTRCEAKTSSGGAMYTQAKTLSITGDSNTFTDCTAQNSGGAVYQARNADGSSVTLENCVFTGCASNAGSGNGGGMYANARTLTITGDNNGFINCTANNAGGGLYHDYAGNSVTIANCSFEGCTAKAGVGGGLRTNTHALTITGEKSIFKNCTAQTNGGGLYHDRSADGSSFTFQDGGFEDCTAVGDYGGAIYSPAKKVTFKDCAVKESTAKSQGGGIYINPSTASFDGCTITGNSVTNSDSKGGGVYVPGGTTTYITYIDSTVSDCEAAYGGGWYQNNGTLYILGGSISGSAVNGGGLYMYESNTKVYQYGGAVGGTATANGGGVYKNNGSYTIGDAVYNEAAYSGASIGGLIVLHSTVDGQETTETVTSSAVNGGGVYQAGGTFTMNAGASIGSAATGEDGEAVYTATATGNGGGIYVGAGWVKIFGGVITNCQALGNGGGIYHASSGNSNDLYFYGADSTARIMNCQAANGGGVYMHSNTFHMGENGKTSLGTIENCRATANGGGVYQEGGNFNLRNTSAIIGCTADNDGGGVYHAGGTYNFIGGSVVRNTALVNGGGVYHAGGSFSMTNGGAVIGGSVESANTANNGAGVFVADGQAATFNGGTVNMAISYNHALTSGGGIAVGGPDAVLTFQGTVTVRHNTMGSQNAECNVYLDQDRNTIIKNNALNAGAYIGVYASDAQDAGHGMQGKPFGTYSNAGNLNVYHNDRREYLYGVMGASNNEVIWPEFVCKITDGTGNLLYKDINGTPAVYSELENTTNSSGNNNSAGAFYTLNVADTPTLYTKDSDGNYSLYVGSEYQVQMLVQNYELGANRQIRLNQNVERKVTLTTASATPDECGFKYTGDARFAATVARTAATSCMIFVGGSSGWELTLKNITFDEKEIVSTQDGGAILSIEGTGKVVLDAGAALLNGRTDSRAGGAVYLKDTASTLIMNAGSKIENCSAGGNNGGAVYLNNGTFTMNGGTISGCSAANGGGVYLINSGKIEMKGGAITGNNATSQGGGIALVNGSARAIFSGYCIVTGNTLNGTTRCNVQFNQDRNDMISSNGLDGRSEIGIYTVDSGSSKIYTKHGSKATPFGTWKQEEDKFFCFINDRDVTLHGVKGPEAGNLIYWEGHPLIRVEKAVLSDRAKDSDETFTFTVKLTFPEDRAAQMLEEYFGKQQNTYGEMVFDKQAKAAFNLKAGQSATASLPFDFFENHVVYNVTEALGETQQEDYTTMAQKDGGEAVESRVVEGVLGENISEDSSKSTSLSQAVFTNTRVTGELTVAKQVTSILPQDLEEEFSFKLTLDDETITKSYPIEKRDDSGSVTSSELSFTEGVADTFILKHGQSITIKELPTDLAYTVEEELTESQRASIRTMVSKDGEEAVSAVKQAGIIGENSVVETVDGVDQAIYASEVVFTNNFLEIVCKITNRSRELLYIREANGNLSEAVFAHLEDAFAQINSGNLRTSRNGTVSGTLRIEMIVPNYAMEGTATLDSGKTVILSTALTTDTDGFPYNKGDDDGDGNVSTVTRGFTEGSMIVDNGVLTLDKITLDGDSTAADADGGIVQVAGPVRLTVNSGATLQNSEVSGNGGAIWLNTGASLVMNGHIDQCSAESGGGVYADAGFTTITTTGAITGCRANSGSGGAIYASTGSSVNLNAGTAMTLNRAEENGGAVYSEANVILRGTVGDTEDKNAGNTAGLDGGGIYMGGNAVFTMYAGSSISGNLAANGGGLATLSTARIAGGALERNSATLRDGVEVSGNGGAIYAGEAASVTISGSPVLAENEAALGGAVYDGGSVIVTGGSMTGNIATEKGGAVYVADGKSFMMSGGRIAPSTEDSAGETVNRSPEGAVSTGAGAVLALSGNTVIYGNTDVNGTTNMNVFLGYDSNSIITTSGLGTSANIGVYVTDGEPEDDSVPDHVDDPIYSDHGLSARNFGTYTGSNLSGARLNKFVNDRDTALNGRDGARIEETGRYYVMWGGKGLQLKASKVDGEETATPTEGISFTLTNNSTGIQVWSGKSAADGLVSIPWAPEEKARGNTATFVPKSTYTLRQTAANEETVLPAGTWTLTIGRDNSVTWEVVPSDDESVDRTLAITSSKAGEKAYLGEVFGVYNDVKPTLTFNATGGKLSDKKDERTETISFTTVETRHTYTIKETNPTWDSHVFKNWATMESKPIGEDGIELTDDELVAKGYFEYEQKDEIVFFRGTEEQENTQNSSKGDLTLYAQWDEVVCKVTDREGKLLYLNGSPAVYGTLEDCFKDYNEATAYSFTYANGSRATARMIEMLIPTYTLNEPVELKRGKTVMLTTAPTTDTDGYAYTGEEGTACVITRGESCDNSMITNLSNLSLMNITLDGGGRSVICDGGIVNNAQTSAVLTIGADATLCNSFVEGNGGAVNAIASTTVYLTGGTISGNGSRGSDSVGTDENGNGAGIYLAKGSRLYLSGNPSFNNNVRDGKLPEDTKNGGDDYTQARQDIYLAGAADEGEALTSITLNGNLADTVPAGSIWVWAEGDNNTEPNHYYMLKQFAVVSFTGTISEATCKAFRNARADEDTDCGGDYLTGQTGDDIGTSRCLYWTGGYDFSFLKVDGFGKPLPGATFTLYTSYASGTENTPYQKGGENVTATSSDGTTKEIYPDPEDSSKAQDAGTVLFSKIAPKTYYMVETTTPTGYVANTNEVTTIYRLTMLSDGTAKLERKMLSEADTAYQEVYKVETQAAVEATDTEPAKPAVYQYRVMNVSDVTRKAILRKVEENTYKPVPGAVFEILRYDRTKVSSTDIHGRTTTAFESGDSGVFFIDMLPYGTYYLRETVIPEGYQNITSGDGCNWFILTVDENGAGYQSAGSSFSNRLNAERSAAD